MFRVLIKVPLSTVWEPEAKAMFYAAGHKDAHMQNWLSADEASLQLLNWIGQGEKQITFLAANCSFDIRMLKLLIKPLPRNWQFGNALSLLPDGKLQTVLLLYHQFDRFLIFLQLCADLGITELPAHTAEADVYALLRLLNSVLLQKSPSEGSAPSEPMEVTSLWSCLADVCRNAKPHRNPRNSQEEEQYTWLKISRGMCAP